MHLRLKIPGYAAGLLFLVQTISACAPSTSQQAQPPPQQNTSTASSPNVQPPSSQQIVLAIGGKSEDGYDPMLGWGRYGSPLFQSTLLRRDENLKLVNDLATRYSISPDRKVWTVNIRPDAKFSDGQPVTAEDVAYTFTEAGKSGGLTDVTVLDLPERRSKLLPQPTFPTAESATPTLRHSGDRCPKTTLFPFPAVSPVPMSCPLAVCLPIAARG